MTGMGTNRPRIVIIGGGFAGLTVARTLRRAAAEVILIDRRNFHCFQPLLYQIATGALSPANIAVPLRAMLAGQGNARVILGEVRDLDAAARVVVLADGARVPWDALVVASGAQTSWFGQDRWAAAACGLKTLEDAIRLRGRILAAFEAAEQCEDAERRRILLTIAVIGGGPTGVEMAGALRELASDIAVEFRRIDARQLRVVLIEGRERILGAFSEELSAAAARQLADLGVDLRLDTTVLELSARHLRLRSPTGEEDLPVGVVVWSAGVAAVPLAGRLASACTVSTDRGGRVEVDDQGAVPGRDDIHVIGDCAHIVQDGIVLPGTAPAAIQAAYGVGWRIRDRLAGRTPRRWRYRDRGNMATIGRHRAVAQVFGRSFSGIPAWLLWLAVHLLQISRHENRLLVVIQWFWSWAWRSRSDRLILVSEPVPDSAPS